MNKKTYLLSISIGYLTIILIVVIILLIISFIWWVSIIDIFKGTIFLFKEPIIGEFLRFLILCVIILIPLGTMVNE